MFYECVCMCACVRACLRLVTMVCTDAVLLKGLIFAETFHSAISRRSDQAKIKNWKQTSKNAFDSSAGIISLSQKKPMAKCNTNLPAMFPAIECLPGIPGVKISGGGGRWEHTPVSTVQVNGSRS